MNQIQCASPTVVSSACRHPQGARVSAPRLPPLVPVLGWPEALRPEVGPASRRHSACFRGNIFSDRVI